MHMRVIVVAARSHSTALRALATRLLFLLLGRLLLSGRCLHRYIAHSRTPFTTFPGVEESPGDSTPPRQA
jgi:hypothetical protein